MQVAGLTPDLSRLDGPVTRPVGVAVSGGGDSLALLHLLRAQLNRPLHVFCVDHGLNPDSADWTRYVAAQAHAVGAAFTPLKWDGPKPRSGLSAAARQARHALLAQAARAADIRVLCLAHTADDVAEAGWMRAKGSTVSPPKLWSPSPVWPQGRGLFLLRPLLGVRRADLRNYLRAKGVGWIEDPANANPDSLRVQARMALHGDITPLPETPPVTSGLSASGLNGQYLGALSLDISAPQDSLRHALALAAVSAGGGDKLPASVRVAQATDAALSGQVARLCGARIELAGDTLLITREGGDIGRNRPATLSLLPGEDGVWDGRWSFVNTTDDPVTVCATRGRRAQLSDREQAFVRTLPSPLRDTLPLIERKGHAPSLIVNRAFCWAPWRFHAAAGMFQSESEL